MTSADFRRIALGMPKAIEGAHMGHPDFRVRRKIFAAIGWPNESWGMVRLTPEQQRECVRAHPAIFVPVSGAWGSQGGTGIHLEAVDEATLRQAITTAWRNIAPKQVVKRFETGTP
jgi:hypothetical protein